MQQLLAGEQRPDAVFAVSDTLAAGAMSAIIQCGLRVPQDVAVSGFDGSELAEGVTAVNYHCPTFAAYWPQSLYAAAAKDRFAAITRRTRYDGLAVNRSR